MAPGAKWIACQGFPSNNAVDAALLACGEFMGAPSKRDGSDENPDLRPHAVNNSWGDCSTEVDDFYDDVIDSWNALGVIAVFSGGNASNCGYDEPPGPNTVGNPGRYTDVFTVGSTGNSDGQYAEHSNWGPTDDVARGLPDFPDNFGYADVKPDVVAPGVSIRSTIGTSDSSYDASVWTGTSMSSPHVTGLMALMIDAGPCLVGNFAEIGTIIKATAIPKPYASENPGGGEGPGNVPNYATGFGEIDALAAVEAAALACGPTGTIAGTVTAAAGGAPVANATVAISHPALDRVYTLATDAQGHYSRIVPAIAGYAVEVSKYGFVSESQSPVAVAASAVSEVDFALDAATFYTLDGTVTDSVTGWGLSARVEIQGYPDGPIYTDPVTGAYSVELAEGYAYSVAAMSLIPGYVAESRGIGALAADATEDFELEAAANCTAPGYSQTPAVAEDFEGETFPLIGWSVLNDGGTCDWNRNDRGGLDEDETLANHTGGGGFAAAANADACGLGTTTRSTLLTPIFNTATLTAPQLTLNYAYRHFGSSSFNIDASADGGGTWANVFSRSASDNPLGPSAQRSFDLTPYQGANTRLRFRYSGGWDYWAQVDRIRVTSQACSTPTGGLIVGRVIDDNTGAGLNGAVVTATPPGGAISTATSADPAIGAGFYYAYAPAGAVALTATPGTLPAGYEDGSANATVTAGATTLADIALAAGRLAFDPAAGTSATVAPGGVATRTLNVRNDGTQPVDYAIQSATVAQDFEGGVGAGGWSVTNNGGDCVWLTNEAYERDNYAGGDGLSAAADSDRCGEDTTMDTSLVSPRIDLSSTSTAALELNLSFRPFTAGASRLRVEASIDNGAHWDNLLTQSTAASPTGPGTPTRVDLSDYVGSTQARVRFTFESDGWEYYAQVDQVRLYTDAGNIAWLALTPDGGTLGPAPASNPHNVVFDASPLPQPGIYAAGLRLVADTPYPAAQADATLTVTTPASYGTLTGTVRSLGYCDATPAPLADANVSIQGNAGIVTTTTDADGEFTWQLPAGQGPFTLTAFAPGHAAAAAPPAALAQGGTATVNIDLRAKLPCFDVLESSLSATAVVGETTTRPLTLSNDGVLGAQWAAEVGGDPNEPVAVALTQSLAPDITPLNAVACSSTTTGAIAENEFFRVYDMADETAGSAPVEIVAVRFGVETADAGAGTTQPAKVRLYTVGADFTYANLTQIAERDVVIGDGDGTFVDAVLTAPVTVPADAKIAVALYVPDGIAAGHVFFPGSNTAGETAPSYVAASTCGLDEPTAYAEVGSGFPDVALRLDLGVEVPGFPCSAAATPVTWLSLAPASGTVAGDSQAVTTATFDAAGLAVGPHLAAVCVASDDPNAASFAIPVSFDATPAGEAIFENGFE